MGVGVAVVLCGSASGARAGGVPAVHGVLQVEAPGATFEGTAPRLGLWADRPAVFAIECTVGEVPFAQQSGTIPPGERWVVNLPAAPPVTTAQCGLFARFANGLSERRAEALVWTWKPVPTEAPETPAAPSTASPRAAQPAKTGTTKAATTKAATTAPQPAAPPTPAPNPAGTIAAPPPRDR